MYPSLWQLSRSGLAMAAVVLMSMSAGEAAAADWKERLLSEAPPKWSALEQYYSKMDVAYRTTVVRTPGTRPPGAFEGTDYVETRQNGGIIVNTRHRVGKTADGKRLDDLRVDGVNSRYAFQLGKTGPEADKFLLVNFEPTNDKARSKVRGKIGFDEPFNPVGIRLVSMINDPLVTIKDVRSVPRKGREWVQVEYHRQLATSDRNQPAQKEKAVEIEHVRMILDPERYWSVQEYHFDDPEWKGELLLEYGDDVDGFPILRRSKYTNSSKKGLSGFIITYEFEKLVHREIPESEFTLSAFDLPELQLPGEQKPQTLWRWLLGIGIALGVLAVLLRVYVKKRHAPQSA
jgi:hypothetical protein